MQFTIILTLLTVFILATAIWAAKHSASVARIETKIDDALSNVKGAALVAEAEAQQIEKKL